MTFEYWWNNERNKIAEPAEDRMTHMVYKQCWDAATKSVMAHVKEAEYAMVGGNLIKENIGWDTADGWFRWIYNKVWGK